MRYTLHAAWTQHTMFMIINSNIDTLELMFKTVSKKGCKHLKKPQKMFLLNDIILPTYKMHRRPQYAF